MKKQGFTLIELMVVIVIMGILAAVAVPKLFGMIAKSKASEVGPAAGTYVKLQQAYFSEANKVGGWQMIGYMAPSGDVASETTNFKYNPSDAIGVATSIALGTGDTRGWTAENKVNLNECKAGVNWAIDMTKSTDTNKGDDVVFKALIDVTSQNGGCAALTPSFTNIGK